jgi:hypothetical protein
VDTAGIDVGDSASNVMADMKQLYHFRPNDISRLFGC